MPQENVEVAHAAIEAFNERDWEAVLEHAGPGSEIDLSRAVGPIHGIYRRDQWKRVMSEFTEYWDTFRIEPHEFIAAVDHIVVPWTVHARGRDGVEVQARVTWTFAVRNGNGILERVCLYQGRDEALEGARLRK